jgi:DivIVA domain-containing protein
VERLRFSLAFRGYRMDEVDDVLDRLTAELRARDARIAEMEGSHAPEAAAPDAGAPVAGAAVAGAPEAAAPEPVHRHARAEHTEPVED